MKIGNLIGGLFILTGVVSAAVPTSQPNVLSPALSYTILHESPTTRPSGAQLIADVIKSEAWVDQLNGLYLEADGLWIRSKEARDAQVRQYQKMLPGMPITVERFPELSPTGREKIVAGVDVKRQYLNRFEENDTREVAFWTGDRFYELNEYSGDHPRKSIFISPKKNPREPLMVFYFEWPRASIHPTINQPIDSDSFQDQMRAIEQKLYADAVVDGPVLYRGVECWVVMLRQQGYERWLVGVKDHLRYARFHGYVFIPPGANTRAKQFADEKQLAEGRKPTDEKHWNQDEYERYQGDVNAALGLRVLSDWEEWTTDYREISAGKWVPFSQGFIIRRANADNTWYEETHHEQTLTKVVVDQPLRDDLFKMDMVAGAEVTDQTYSPTIRYRWKPDFTQQEWQKILDDARENQERIDQMQAALNGVLNKPAAEFPQSQWLNSKPLTWKDLRGKVVILDFFAEWCGPCRNDYPTMVQLHHQSKESGAVVIGIHTPVDNLDKLKALMKQYRMDYPICIDTTAPEGANSFGKMSAAFGVRGIPQSFLIDASGIVRAQGSLGKMIEAIPQYKSSSTTTGP